MQDSATVTPENSFQLIFTIVLNPILGYLIEPYVVKKLKSGQWSYEFYRVSRITAKDYLGELNNVQKSLLEAYQHYGDDTLFQKFNKQRLKPAEFYQSLTPEFVSLSIRPIADKYMARMVDIMQANALHLYYIGTKGEFIRETPIEIAPGYVDPVFHFEKTTTGLQYKLKLYHNGSELALLTPETYLLAHFPCLLVYRGCLYRFHKGWEGKRIIPFLTKEMVLIPKSAEKAYFQKFVLDVLRNYRVVGTGFPLEVVDNDPVFRLKLEQNWQNHWVLQFKSDYSKAQFDYGDQTPSKVHMQQHGDDFGFTKILRHPEKETAFAARLESLGLINRQGDGFYLWYPAKRHNESGGPALAGFYDYMDWMSERRESLDVEIIETFLDNSTKRYFLGKPSLRMTVTDKNDWFDLHTIVQFGQFDIPFYKLRNDILAGNREILLPDGSIGILPEEWLSRYFDIFKHAVVKGGTILLKKHHFTLLERIRPDTTIIDSALQSMSNFAPPVVPPQLNAILRPYQEKGYQWMSFLHQNKMGGCLADDMGLGKTLQTLTILLQTHKIAVDKIDTPENQPIISHGTISRQLTLDEELPLQSNGKPGASLLIMPLSLIHNWIQEIKKFAPSLEFVQYTGAARSLSQYDFMQNDLILTTYGTVRNDVDFLQNFSFNYIVLDESQVIKNSESKTFHAIKRLNARHRLALTGTPIENSLTDLWAQFSFLNPGLLGSSHYFREEFVTPIERNSDAIRQKKLQALVEPFILRRTKAQVAEDLPELTETVRYCEMSEEQQKYYEEKKSQIRNLIFEQVEKQGFEKARFFILGNLMKLRLLANHPYMVDSEFAHESGKFTAVSQNINDLIAEGHKVLIFSQFVKHLNIYKSHFEDNNLPFVMLTGKNTELERAELIKQFNTDPGTKLFLISLKAGGVGLNLTAADYVFLLDPWWNPAVERQAISRAHRIGQTKNVFVYKYITIKTVEEKILLLQKRKEGLADMLADRSNPFKNLGLDEINELIE